MATDENPPGWKRRLRDWDAARRRRRRGELTYPEWAARYDTLDDADLPALRERRRRLRAEPLISVLMPVYNPRPQWLREALDSVRAQLYERWQLCVADDRSTDPEVRRILSEYAALDPRIRVAFRESNGHISAASNSALEMAEGEYAALLDHDDLLPRHALLCVAETIDRFPDAAVIYSDEDKIDADGQRCGAYFKPDWNPELFRGYNLISHLGVYRTGLIRAAGGFRVGYEGAQDYDLALRCIESVEAQRIVHIPQVLYHWRIHEASTAGGNATKPYALDAGRRALQEHLARNALEAEVVPHSAGWYQVDYALAHPTPAVTVIVVDDGDAGALQRCVDSLLAHDDYGLCEWIVASRSDRPALPERWSHAGVRRIASPRAATPAALRNAAAHAAGADILVFVDSRCEIAEPGWLGKLVSFAARPGTGAVAPKRVTPEGRIAGGGVLLGLHDGVGLLGRGARADEIGYYGRTRLSQNLSALDDGCIAIARSAFERVGGYPQDYRSAQGAAVALCLRLQDAGLRNVWVPSLHVRSHPPTRWAAWRQRQRIRSDLARLRSAWPEWMSRDPAYNPNLTAARDNFTLANPPRIDNRNPWFAARVAPKAIPGD
ncbi:glycosyltransferase [Luteimonas sp. SX5]|uniref:Glycosyltransferase n=1 Tax=Luteimonas galliterrae TaxID=2940486 RepID=A0ABT0MLG8_9GAMM|nr:glycosyltransferase [Luteimonas galliterrae]MCL1635726.1 glycosyltransferase [Luteimonas galliterrae]